tara:strand:- start:1053 stop:1607 length:555 start_codon:yes stop_codon:yes gene_type:complete
MHLIKFLFVNLFLLAPLDAFSMQIINNSDPKKNIFNHTWEFVSDDVMGGKSVGQFNVNYKEGEIFYRLRGKVSTENNGGFIQFRSKIEINDPSLKGIKFKVRGNGEKYFVHVRTPFTFLPWQYYSYSFYTQNEWTEIKFLLSDFKKSHKLQPSEFLSTKIKSIAFVAFGQDYDAELDIKDLEFF